MSKPDLCPDRDCPPAKAVPAQGIFYRTVKTCPPTHRDFLSYLEEGKKVRNPGKECMAWGISVFKSLEDARHHQNLFPVGNPQLAKTELSPNDGAIQHTPSRQYPNHVTWWPKKETVRHNLFLIVQQQRGYAKRYRLLEIRIWSIITSRFYLFSCPFSALRKRLHSCYAPFFLP